MSFVPKTLTARLVPTKLVLIGVLTLENSNCQEEGTAVKVTEDGSAIQISKYNVFLFV
jgi:hypothetical protein